MKQAPLPPADREGAVEWVCRYLDGLYSGEPAGSDRYSGGQSAADLALASFDVAGYANRRNEVLPPQRRGASGLSPYIRHGLLPLRAVWDAVDGGPQRDVAKFRDELLWQEYARHLYARLGSAMGSALRSQRRTLTAEWSWDPDMACVAASLAELHDTGWMVNQARMWMASEWAVRHGAFWRDGEDHFFRHLLDGSRAANRLGWQWTAGLATGREYGFSRYQVTKRAPALCGTCPYDDDCPIEEWPRSEPPEPIEPDPRLGADPDTVLTAGPSNVERHEEPEAVWLTAESLGDTDPAARAHPKMPAVFVFDAPLLRRLELSAKRLVFLAETLAEIGANRPLEVDVGDPVATLAGRPLAATFSPVPGWRRRSAQLDIVEVHPWPWLAPPHGGSAASFSAWRKHIEVA